MIRLLILLLSSGITFNSWAQSAKRNDYDAHKELVKAEKYIPEFAEDSVKRMLSHIPCACQERISEYEIRCSTKI